MGDRGNIKIIGTGPAPLYFYTHWRGSDMKEVVAEALAKKERWNDAGYLARIIFDTLTEGAERGETTGYGIGTEPEDNEYPFFVVDIEKQVVYEEADTRKGFGILPETEESTKPVSFDAFLENRAKSSHAA